MSEHQPPSTAYAAPRPLHQKDQLPPLREVVSPVLLDDGHGHAQVDRGLPPPSVAAYPAATYGHLDARSTYSSASTSSRQAGSPRRPSSSGRALSELSPRFTDSGRDSSSAGSVHLPRFAVPGPRTGGPPAARASSTTACPPRTLDCRGVVGLTCRAMESPFPPGSSTTTTTTTATHPPPPPPLNPPRDRELAARQSLPPIYTPDHSAVPPPHLSSRGHVQPREPSSYEPVDPASQFYGSMADRHAHASREGPPSPYQAYSPGQYRNDGYPYGSHAGLEMASPLGYGPSNGAHAEGRTRKRRGNLPKPVTDLLKAWFRTHQSHPYPSEEEKQLLMCQTGLTITQLSNWFINARRRELPEMDRQARANAMTQQTAGTESDES